MKINEHSMVSELKDSLLKGKIDRREFIRKSALLGLSLSAINGFLSLINTKTISADNDIKINRGGMLRIALPGIARSPHPARYTMTRDTWPARLYLDYLTRTDENMTHPHLLDKWEASEDLKTWTLYLRKDVTWSNGDKFVADDVVFTMKEWLNPDVGSGKLGQMSYLKPNNIEKVNNYQVKLHLERGTISVPEDLTHAAYILNHRTFEGDIFRNPVGTGAFIMEEYIEDEIAIFKARDDYWKNGVDGKPLPYLDEVHFYDLGDEKSAWLTAYNDGSVDAILERLDAGDARRFEDDPNTVFDNVESATCNPIRMRVDKKPWDDNRVRQALKLCQHRENMIEATSRGYGTIGEDHHVSKAHPAYYPMEAPDYQPERAKELLIEAGYDNGLDVELVVAPVRAEILQMAEILRQSAEPAGFRININNVPGTVYWDEWLDLPFSITPWGHRQLGTQVLNLAYSADEEGNPVEWNETRWVDTEFNELLEKANSILDVDKRRNIMGQIQKIQQERGSVGIPFWIPVFGLHRYGYKNLNIHPTRHYFCDDVWFDSEEI